ncbi:hypothetical protein ACJMK2_011378 [Sinanodonta woodiana]|uniref:FAM234A/B beta-propeller domain-containing protein n=1 Tax=Sinanodonta woodiana TaxID=1069815 RepID=A0ABD3V5C4_SINWO
MGQGRPRKKPKYASYLHDELVEMPSDYNGSIVDHDHIICDAVSGLYAESISSTDAVPFRKSGGTSNLPCSQHLKRYTHLSLTDDESSEEETLMKPNDLELNSIDVQTTLNRCGSEFQTQQHKPHKMASKQKNTYTIFCLAVAISLLVIVIVILIFAHLSYVPGSKQVTLPVVEQSLKTTAKMITAPMALDPQKQTDNWVVRLPHRATEANVRLVDVDGDGLLDIIVSTTKISEKDMAKIKDKMDPKDEICHREDWLGKEYPCMGNLMAYRGYDGKQLWATSCKAGMFAINCEEFDVNKDGKKDCIGAGRHAILNAFDPYKGVILWEREVGTFLRTDWNTYLPRALPDWDGDGVPEVLVVNGGAPSIPSYVHNRTAGRLIVFSGATGRLLGVRYLNIPHSKESYMSPVIYKSKTGSSYILFGSGGETVPGIFSIDTMKGVMVPPVIVDVNRDGIDDIVVNSFGGWVLLLDGVNLRPIWTADFNGMESFSTPAPGYFDNDDYIDFMMHHNVGAWPYYTFSYTTIISGKDGRKLWTLQSNLDESGSDFTLRTQQNHRDIFVFRVKGRDSSIMFNSDGEVVRTKDISQIRETRKKRHTKDVEYDVSLPPGLEIKEKNTMNEEEHCMILQTDDFLTGAIADVDGDGTLEYLSIISLQGTKLNFDSTNTSTEFVTRISKVNIFPNFRSMDKIHLDAATSITRNSEERDIDEVGVLPPEQQQWTQYMGSESDSHYYNG